MSRKNLEHLEKIKDAVKHKENMSDEQKSLTLKKIQEWELEGKGMDLLGEQLMKISQEIRPILKEIGLL